MPSARSGAQRESKNTTFEESLASKPFVFVVGPEHKEFHLHKQLVAQLSPALNALVNGRLKEAQEGRVEWLDLDVETFLRFARYIYSGDYLEPESEPELEYTTQPEKPLHSDNPSSCPSESNTEATFDSSSEGSVSGDEGDTDGDGSTNGGYGQDNPEISIVTADFHDDHDSVLAHECTSYKRFPYSMFTYLRERKPLIELGRAEWNEDQHGKPAEKKRRVEATYERHYAHAVNTKYSTMHYFKTAFTCMGESWGPFSWTPAAIESDDLNSLDLLCHARLYFLADKYDICNLRRIALCRLGRTLLYYQVSFERISELLDLAMTIYENTTEQDDARNIISVYFSCFFEDIETCPEVREAVRRGGDFVIDLMKNLSHRLTL